MGMQSLEREILAEAKCVTGNNKLRMKDIMEWSSGDIEPQEGEIVYQLPGIRVNIAVKKSV